MDASQTQRAQGQSGRAGESGPADLKFACAKAWGGPLFKLLYQKIIRLLYFAVTPRYYLVYSLQPQ